MTLLKVLALFGVALIAGGWMMGTFLVVPAQKKLTASEYTAVEQANTSVGARYYPVVMASTVMALITLLVLTIRSGRPSLLIALSLAFVIGALAFTAAKMVPINKHVDTWSIQSPPANWQVTRDAWHTNHRIRTALAVIAFLLLCTAIVQNNQTKANSQVSAGKTAALANGSSLWR